MSEPRATDSGSCRPSVYWVAHGSALARVAPEHVRAELPRERLARLQHFPEIALNRPVQDTIRRALQPVRGPVRFSDLAPAISSISSDSGGTSFANASSAQPDPIFHDNAAAEHHEDSKEDQQEDPPALHV